MNFEGKIAQGVNGIVRRLLEFTVLLEIIEYGERKMFLERRRSFKIFFNLKQTMGYFTIFRP